MDVLGYLFAYQCFFQFKEKGVVSLKKTILKAILLTAVMVMAMVSACSKGYDDAKDFEARGIDGGKGVEITGHVGGKWEVRIPQKIQGYLLLISGGGVL